MLEISLLPQALTLWSSFAYAEQGWPMMRDNKFVTWASLWSGLWLSTSAKAFSFAGLEFTSKSYSEKNEKLAVYFLSKMKWPSRHAQRRIIWIDHKRLQAQ